MAPLSSRDLQAFMAIAEELSFRRAAERVFIDQSALSRRMQNLEESLGFQLIFRTTREVMLTEAGRVFYEEIAPAMSRLARAGDVARVAAEGKTGRLRVAYMSFAATEVMPERSDHVVAAVHVHAGADEIGALHRRRAEAAGATSPTSPKRPIGSSFFLFSSQSCGRPSSSGVLMGPGLRQFTVMPSRATS
jgi:DNA-binding transcriptional LysR family regulator